MHLLCRCAPFYKLCRRSLLATTFLVVFHAAVVHGESGRGKDDFPPEVDYPDEAYDSDQDADRQESDDNHLKPRDVRERKMKRAPKDKPRARVEKMPLQDEPPGGPSLWSYSLEVMGGLNQVGATAAVDPNRDTVGLSQSLLLGGRVAIFRGRWGLEVDGRYAFTPVQEVIFPTAPPTTQYRALKTMSVLSALAYRYGFGGPAGRFHLIGRLGYGLMSVGQDVDANGAIIAHTAQVGALFLGLGLEARWQRWWSTQFDFYQSIVGGGTLGPTAAPSGATGFGYWSLTLANRFRLTTWGDIDSQKTFGVGALLTLQQLSTPTPPAGNLVGEGESFMQLLATGYLTF